MAPMLSPRGDRVIYTRVETNAARLWISAVGGSAPIRATTDNSVGSAEFSGAWSPDGAWFVYLAQGQNAVNLMKVKTTGEAAPVLLKSNLENPHVPDWSRDGQWIVCGTLLMSADGRTERTLKPYLSPHLAFAKDSRLLYGIRSENGQNTLFAIDVASGAERVIGATNGLAPLSNLTPSLHFSLAPDGSSLVYSTGLFRTSLWMLEGFDQPHSLASRLGWR
jgi:Tol biopolymer transport system component